MGNFLRRFLSFIMGIAFGFVSLGIAITSVGYTVYKNASLKDLGVVEDQVDLGGISDATIEEIISFLSSATKDPESYTFGELEKEYDFDLNGMLASMGLDANALHPDDLRAIKNLSPIKLFNFNGENPLNDVSFGVIFAFIPETNGVYPLFSESARAKLRTYTIGEALEPNANGELAITEIINNMPIGSILSSMYVETFDTNTGEFVYTAIDGGVLDTIGGVTLKEFTTLSADLGYEFNEGVLSTLGSTTIGDLFAMQDDGTLLSSILLNNTLGDLFVKNGNTYTFDFLVLLQGLKVGSLMGMTNNNGNWYDANNNVVTDDDIAGALMLNLYELDVQTLVNGTFDVTVLTTDVYFGQALGFTKCDATCTLTHDHSLWYDAQGNYAGDLNNAISGISLEDCMKGQLDIMSTLGGISVGGLMGFKKVGNDWYDSNNNLVSDDDIAGALMIGLYDKTLQDLMSGSFDLAGLTNGIYLGQALGFTKCDSTCTLTHDHSLWYDSNGNYAGDLNNALSNVSLKDVMDGKLKIDTVLGSVSVGGLMGYTKVGNDWYDSNNVKVGDDIANTLMKGIYDKTITELMNGGIDLAELTKGIYLGKAFGYTQGTDGKWYDSNSKYVGEMNNALSNVSLKDVVEGKLDIDSTLGGISVGGLMGYTKVGNDWYDANNVKVGDSIADELMKGLYDKTITDLMNGGIDLSTLADGIYLGKALGYTQGGDGKWYDSNSKYVGEMNDALSNVSLKDVMDGKLDIQATLGNVKVGSIMGYTKVGNDWYDANGTLITDELVSDKISLQLYDLTFLELTNGGFDISELTDGIYFGKALGYVKCETGCQLTHDHSKWYDKNGNFVGEVNNAIANIELVDAMRGSININETLKLVKLGEIMGKRYENGKWYDGATEIVADNVANEIMLKLYDKTYNEITTTGIDFASLTDGIYFGKVLGYTQGGDGKWYDNGNYVGEINNALASLKFSDAITSGINIDEVLKAVKLGEIMGKRYENGKWYDGATEIVADNVANEIMLKLYSKTYSEITTTGIDFATLTDGIYFGKVLGYTQQADGKWYKNGKFVGEMDNAIASLKLSDAMTTGVNIDDAIKNVKLGEIMGKRYENGKWYDGDTEIIANSIANDIMIKLYSKTYSEITTTGIDFAMLTEGVYFGKALGYEIGSTTDTAYCENNCLANHTHKYYWVKNGKFVGDMNNAMSNISLQQAMQGKVTIDGLFDDVKLGYIMGHSYDNGKWYDADGNLINYDELDDGGQKILYKMYNQTVGVLTHNGFALDVVLKGMKVGEIMGYKYESNKWQKPSTTGYIDATAIESLMADINMEDMLNGNVDYKSKINNLSLGDVIDVSSSKVLSSLANTNIGGLSTAIESLSIGKLMGYVKNGDKWYDNGKEVTGLYGALSEYTIGQLSAGNVSIDNLKIGDLITVADSPILALLKDKTLSDAPHAANKLYLGEVMGYTKQADGKWYKNGVEATKITAKMADYTIEQVADGELDKIMASLTIGDVLSADKGVFAVMEIGSFTDGDTTYSAYDSAAQVPVSEISIRLTRGVKNASYTALKSAGIDLFDAETEASIDSFYSSIYPMLNPTKPVSNWKDQQLTKIVKDIVDTMNLLANRG